MSALQSATSSTSLLAGRILIATIFILSGLSKIAAPEATIGYIASVGLPFPELGFALAVAAEIGGGLIFLVGLQTRLISLLLAVFTLTTAVFFHNNFADQNQMIHFLKNVSIAGGFLTVAAVGGGAFSLDTLLGQRQAIKANA
jgi:putative oxidoreductase